jgi:hypothetical protein
MPALVGALATCLCVCGVLAQPSALDRGERKCRWDGSPIWWVKAPKTASTFGNILVRAVCPHAHIKTPLQDTGLTFLDEHGCRESNPLIGYLRPGHAPLPLEVEEGKYAILTIVREPISRIVSGYLHNLHDCKALQKEVGGISDDRDVGLFHNAELRKRVYGTDGINLHLLLRYARCVSACQTRMMLGAACGERYGALSAGFNHSLVDGNNVTSVPGVQAQRMVVDAVRRVQHELAFVGVTNRYTETMRSLSFYLRVRILPRLDYYNTRPSWASPGQVAMGKAALRSRGFTPVDTFVYQAASKWLSDFKGKCRVTD